MTTGLRRRDKKPTVVDNWSRKKAKSTVDDNWSRDGTMPWYKAGVDFGYEENLFGDDRRSNCLLFFIHALCKLFMHGDNRYFFSITATGL